MTKRGKLRLISYLTAGALGLGCFAGARSFDLRDARRTANTAAARAFEETVTAVDGLSATLAKSVYATDGGYCAKLCAQALAQAQAAESALSILPFSTQELEQTAGFLNLAGDYAESLCANAAREGFTEEQTETLTELSAVAASLADSLRELQSGVHGGEVVYDSPALRMQNVDPARLPERLSARMLAGEAAFEAPETPRYDGKFSRTERDSRGWLTEEDMRKLAASYAGVEPEDLGEEYVCQSGGGQRCYRAGDLYLSVSRRGVESLAQSRLVGESRIDVREALRSAKAWLREKGYRDLALAGTEINGAVAEFRFVKTENGVRCLDNGLRLAIALDDGSLYSFNAADYSGEDSGARFTVTEEEARQALPASLSVSDAEKLIRRSPGGRDLTCYAFSCVDEQGRAVTVLVDAADGRMWDVEL